ncbi:MAG: glycogen debranching protein GlgX [Pirellulaceae bacterium]|nr:glycogen debranching protein GlgX [Pirellulaceae bacterium]
MLMRYPQIQTDLKSAPSYGAITTESGVEFLVYSHSATAMRLLLYDQVGDLEPAEVIDLDPDGDRWGDVWRGFVRGIGHGQLYHLQADGPFDPNRGYWFDGSRRLIDPYAHALAGDFQKPADGIIRPPKCVVVADDFDWEGDRCLNYDLADSVIYEAHVRGFTKHPSSGVDAPGTYLGMLDKIQYLKSLGITAIELMPVHEFPILAPDGRPLDRPNYWGYDPMAFFSPHRGYAESREPGAQVEEFKTLVKEMHRAGIEVILDVVFNHTCEGNEHGPVLSFKGLENHTYYLLDHDGKYYRNYSGCGNTINCNHPVVRRLIMDCLRHWVLNYHVDGFRFDLASILSRGRDGNLNCSSPLVEEIAEDPVLARTKIIAEAWDAAGAYQVGSFWGIRWAEWNGRYRDDVRRFWRGDGHMLGAIATRLAGSSDLYEHSGRSPEASVNLITTHDGFTLNDLVSFRQKHNHANGENNGDGDNHNCSENYGWEGELRNAELDPATCSEIEEVRTRQIKNMMATLLLSHGVPMLLSGDECRRTQWGNNNAYCQDNEISWFDWNLIHEHRELLRFCRVLIRFRREQPTVRRRRFPRGDSNGSNGRPEVSWYGMRGDAVDWHSELNALTCLWSALPANEDPEGLSRDVMLVMNATPGSHVFTFPQVAMEQSWRLFVDTAAKPPGDIYPSLKGPAAPNSGRVILKPRSMRCYVSDSP